MADTSSVLSIPEHPCPPGFTSHRYERSWNLTQAVDEVWQILNDPLTFTKGQIPPMRVEFLGTKRSGGIDDFTTGVLCAHHGPGFLFAGEIGEIVEGQKRDLHYVYGSYVISLRMIRPVFLGFTCAAAPDGGTVLTLRVDSYVKPWCAGVWTVVQQVFWKFFPRFLKVH